VTAVTSRVARHAAFATELGARRRELGTAVVAEPARTRHSASAATATHVAAVVSWTGRCSAASMHRDCAWRTVAVAGTVTVAAVGLAWRSVGAVAGRGHDAAPANVTGTGVLRAAVITTSQHNRTFTPITAGVSR